MRRHKISDVAKDVGVTPGTLRQWEQYGVLTPVREPSGHRTYTTEQLNKARDIARLRSLGGLSLSEIKFRLNAAERDNTSSILLTERELLTAGEQIRRMRLKRGLSIQNLAEKLKVSASTISTFERTSKGVGVKLMRALADYFGVTVTQLTTSAQPRRTGPVRKHEGQRIETLGKGIHVRALATGERMMDAKEWKLEPGAQSNGSYSHEGEEFVYVISGHIELNVEGLGVVRLGPRDSLYFESTRKHSWINPGEVVCTVVWVNTPASF
jgi:DNA-binding transcriptional MerR regulator/quercetin dioxygenase-like cupin family protein